MQAKIKDLKQSLNTEFRLIHELCLFVLNASQKPDLIRATLATLHAYLSWVPLGYIFESNIVEVLLKLFPQPPFRNVALQCLTEVRDWLDVTGRPVHLEARHYSHADASLVQNADLTQR